MQPHMVPGLKETLASSWLKRTGELTWLEGIASTLLCNTLAKLVLFFLNVAITAGRPKCPANDNSCSSIFSDSCRSNLSSWSKSIWGEIFPTIRVLQSKNLQACVNNLSQQSETVGNVPELLRIRSDRVKAVRRRGCELPTEKSRLCLGWAIGSEAKSYLQNKGN